MLAWDLTNILVGDNESNEKIWENGEKSTIAGSILCVVYDNRHKPEYQNLTNVYWFIAEMAISLYGRSPMEKYLQRMDDNHPARAILSIANVAPARTKGSFDTSALGTLKLFTLQMMYGMTMKCDFDIAEIDKKKMVLFFILPDEKTTFYPVATLIIDQLYEILVSESNKNGGRLARRVNYLLDEFGNFTRLTDFINKLTVGGGRGIRFHLFLQSFAQLKEKYNEDIATIIRGNCENWIYLQAEDEETLETFSKKLGKYTTSNYQVSAQHGSYVNPTSGHSISLMERELLKTDEIKLISRPYQLVTSRSYPSMMNAPDLSNWYFNKMCGMGDELHNKALRLRREEEREYRRMESKVQLWGIWKAYKKEIEEEYAMAMMEQLLNKQAKKANTIKRNGGNKNNVE